MTDIVDTQTRSKMMSAVRAKNTKIELEIRHRLFHMGFRYQLHSKNLPGTPDIVFPKYSAVIFVNGCFWHYHGCSRSRIPDTRRNWWRKKLEATRTRDAKKIAELQRNGWGVIVIWECSVRRPGIERQNALDMVCNRVGEFLRSNIKILDISGPKSEIALEINEAI